MDVPFSRQFLGTPGAAPVTFAAALPPDTRFGRICLGWRMSIEEV